MNGTLHYHAFAPEAPCYAYTCPNCQLRDHRAGRIGSGDRWTSQGNQGTFDCLRCGKPLIEYRSHKSGRRVKAPR